MIGVQSLTMMNPLTHLQRVKEEEDTLVHAVHLSEETMTQITRLFKVFNACLFTRKECGMYIIIMLLIDD